MNPLAIATETGNGLATKSNRFRFTDKSIRALKPRPNSKRDYYRDDEVRGLQIGVNAGGTKTFYLSRFISGRHERVPLGAFPEMNTEAARAKAINLNSSIIDGGNPAEERREIRDGQTLQEMFDYWLTNYAQEHKRTWKDDEWKFGKYLHSWRLRRIVEITKNDVVQLHAHLGRVHGHYTANRVIELLSAMYSRAISDWGYKHTNPAAGVKGYKETKRRRFLKGEELPAFFQSLAQEKNEVIRDFLLVALLAGARRSNVQSMMWEEIDWVHLLWTIPAQKAKSSEDVVVVLTEPVVAILRRRQASSLSPFVFPGRGRTHHLVEPKKCWKNILKRAGLTDLRLHDLRRSLGSYQAIAGSSLLVIGQSLGHTSTAATKIYSQLSTDPVRQSVERAQQAMFTLGGIAGLLEDKTRS